MTAWTAIWAPGPSRMRWELTITDEAGNVAMTHRSTAPVVSRHPLDGFLVALGLCPKGSWEAGEGGSFRCPVLASEEMEDTLVQGLLARGRSDPGARAVRG